MRDFLASRRMAIPWGVALLLVGISAAAAAAAVGVVTATSRAGKGPVPPPPVITRQPSDPTLQTKAHFQYRDEQNAVRFRCKLDDRGYTRCGSAKNYTRLASGSHTFCVKAVNKAGISSSPTCSTWTVGTASALPFTVSGDAPGMMYPGDSGRLIPLTLHNPNGVTIYVTGLFARIQSTGAAGCSASWFQIIQASVPSGGIAVPANGSVVLPAQGATTPSIQMIESGTNQGACQNAGLMLSYTGSAHS